MIKKVRPPPLNLKGLLMKQEEEEEEEEENDDDDDGLENSNDEPEIGTFQENPNTEITQNHLNLTLLSQTQQQ